MLNLWDACPYVLNTFHLPNSLLTKLKPVRGPSFKASTIITSWIRIKMNISLLNGACWLGRNQNRVPGTAWHIHAQHGGAATASAVTAATDMLAGR